MGQIDDMTKHQKRWWVPLLVVVSCLCIGAPVIFETMYRPFKVPTGTMKPTILGIETLPDGSRTIGDHVFVNKVVYKFWAPARGDVVVFSTKKILHSAVRQNEYFVKRIVGLPGETISISPPYVMANGKRIEEPEIFRIMAEQKNGYSGYKLASKTGTEPKSFLATTNDELRLGPDEYLVFGDNSASSLDGRYFGPIKRGAIIGPVTFRYFPFNRIGRIL